MQHKCISSTQQRFLDRRVIATALLPAQGVTRSMTRLEKTDTQPVPNTHSHSYTYTRARSQSLDSYRYVILINHSQRRSRRVTGGRDGWMCMYVCAFPPVWGEEMVKWQLGEVISTLRSCITHRVHGNNHLPLLERGLKHTVWNVCYCGGGGWLL